MDGLPHALAGIMSPLQFDFGLAFKKKTFQSSRGLHKGTFHNSTRTSQDSWLPRSTGGEAGPAGAGGLKGTTGFHVATFSSGLPAWGGLGSLKDCGWHGAGGPHSLPRCPGRGRGLPAWGQGILRGQLGSRVKSLHLKLKELVPAELGTQGHSVTRWARTEAGFRMSVAAWHMPCAGPPAPGVPGPLLPSLPHGFISAL